MVGGGESRLFYDPRWKVMPADGASLNWWLELLFLERILEFGCSEVSEAVKRRGPLILEWKVPRRSPRVNYPR